MQITWYYLSFISLEENTDLFTLMFTLNNSMPLQEGDVPRQGFQAQEAGWPIDDVEEGKGHGKHDPGVEVNHRRPPSHGVSDPCQAEPPAAVGSGDWPAKPGARSQRDGPFSGGLGWLLGIFGFADGAEG